METKQTTFSAVIIIVDTNILFSALISPNGKISRLMSFPPNPVQYITCHYAFAELFKHQEKIVRLSKKSIDDVVDDLSTLINRLQLYNEALIEQQHWQEADRLTVDVDSFDISYVALTLQIGGWLWTGDKKLTKHLKAMEFDCVLNTDEFYEKLTA